MKAIILAEVTDQHVVNKYWRPFYKDLCLVDIQIKQLLKSGFKKHQINVVSDEARGLMLAKRKYQVETINQAPWSFSEENAVRDLLAGIVSRMSLRSDVAICRPLAPTFEGYAQVMSDFKMRTKDVGSVAVTFPSADRLMIGQDYMSPLGWSCGSHHAARSQRIVEMPLCFSIVERKRFIDEPYFYTTDCAFHVTERRHIAIKTMEDFRDAKGVYESRRAVAALDASKRKRNKA